MSEGKGLATPQEFIEKFATGGLTVEARQIPLFQAVALFMIADALQDVAKAIRGKAAP